MHHQRLIHPDRARCATRHWISGLLCSVFLTGCLTALRAQEPSLGSAAYGATAQERLLMEQIHQLASAGQYAEARASLERLVDNSQGRLIELTPVTKAATLQVQTHAPIADWAQHQLHRWRRAAPDKLRDAIRVEQALAVKAIESAQAKHDHVELRKAVDRYALVPASIDGRLFLCDLYLDMGWTAAARAAIETPNMSLRLQMNDAAGAMGVSSRLPWPLIWPRLSKLAALPELLEYRQTGLATDYVAGQERLVSELVQRQLDIAAFEGSQREFENSCAWATALATKLPKDLAERTEDAIKRSRAYFAQHQAQLEQRPASRWQTFAGDASRSGANRLTSEPTSWPKWTRQLDRITGSSDRNPASKPPVAENMLSLLPYHPAVYDGRVYVNELTRIMAYNLNDGAIWPPTDPALPLFDSGMTAANYLPFGYAIMGAPRGTVTIEDDVLYARMGPPVTGWFGRPPGNIATSLSYLVALDLKRQGSMRPGFPVRLDLEKFPSAEFEGAPVVIGDRVIACVGSRDNVNLRRYVCSIDQRSGEVQWKSPVLASGTVSGSEQASLISHQLVTASGGRLYVNTNLGAIACLEQSTGEIAWLARYRRSQPSAEAPYVKQDRYRYRDLTPCMLVGSQVICAPQDCPELFALDSTTGELLWSTDAEQVDEATQLLGSHEESIIVGGDRIFWLDRSSGRVVAAFPAGGVGDAASALPAPRGFGRGVVGGGKVYWPTQNEIFVFDANQLPAPESGSPTIRKRYRLDTRGAEGGNLVLLEDGILVAGANRLFVFRK